MDGAVNPFEAIISPIGSVFSELLSEMGEVCGTIIDHPLLLILVILPLVGLGVGLFKRLINVN